MGSLNTEHLSSLLGVIGATEDSIHVLEGDALSFRDTEPDKDGEQDINGEEEEKALEAGLGEEGREELLEDGVGHVLALRGHTDGLSSNVG